MLRAVILFIASSLLSASLVAAPQFTQRLANGESLTVVVYGTSLTERGAWPELMQAELHRRYKGRIHLINGAMSGQTSKWGVMNIEDRVIQKRPDVLFIEFAINDAHRRFEIDVDDTRRNFRRMVQRVKKALPECEIILMTMSDAKGEAEYNRQFRLHEYYQAVRDVAAESGLTLIDLYPQWQRLRLGDEGLYDRYMPDGLHPTEEATRHFIIPALIKELESQKSPVRF